MQPSSDHGHGHGDHGAHGEAGDHETPEQQDGQEAEQQDGQEAEQQDGQEEKPAPNVEPKERVTSGNRMDSDKVTETEGKDQITSGGNEMTKDTNKPTPEGEPATKDEEHIVETPENKGSVEGVRFKGATKQGGDDNMEPDTRKHIPDAKGGAKKRIESGYGQDIGASTEPENEDEEGSAKDRVRSRATHDLLHQMILTCEFAAIQLKGAFEPEPYVWQAARSLKRAHEALNRHLQQPRQEQEG